jgi:hypothetical protein
MRNPMTRQGTVSVCNASGCIHAKGKYADQITTAIIAILVLIGFGIFVKTIK